MKTAIFAAAAAAIVATASDARTSVTIYKYDVNALGSGEFEVVSKFASAGGAAGHWCGAGEYASRYLGANNSTRIYLSEPYGPSRAGRSASGVGFTITPSAELAQQGGPFAGNVSYNQVGANLTVGKARLFCDFTIDM